MAGLVVRSLAAAEYFGRNVESSKHREARVSGASAWRTTLTPDEQM